MNPIFRLSIIIFVATFCLIKPVNAQFGSFFGQDKSIAEQREDILIKNQAILKQLYDAQPKSKVLIAGGGTGTGVVISKSNKKPVFMNMAEVQAGLGIGIKSFQNIFVFETEAVMNDFINSGWTFGEQVTAAAKYEKDGGAYQDATVVAPGVLMYQLTDSGLAAEITGKGTKYYKNTDLNK